MTPTSGHVDTPDVRLHYLDWGGDGPPLLLVHATGFHAWLWQPYAEALRGRFRVVALDQRGHGDSGLPVNGFHWGHFPGDVLAVIRHLGIEGCYAAGHSSGGAAVAVCAGRYSGSISRALLIDPVLHPEPDSPVGPNVMAERAEKRRHVWESPHQFEETMAQRGAFTRWQPPFLSLYARHGLRRRPDGHYELKCSPESEAAVYRGAADWTFWPDLERLAIPVALLRATGKDSPTPPDAAARIPGCRETLVNTTHFIPMEAPDTVLTAMTTLFEP